MSFQHANVTPLTAFQSSMQAALPAARSIWGLTEHIMAQSVKIKGLSDVASLGDIISVEIADDEELQKGEIIALEGDIAIAMIFGDTTGMRVGNKVYLIDETPICPSPAWLGKTLNYYGQMISGEAPPKGSNAVNLKASPPPAILRKALGPRLTTGVAALDTFLPICQGQRIGLFAGSGVGKSTLLGSLARSSGAEINIIALIGERGREVRHFIEHTLGEDGMKKTILFVATSDEPSAMKIRTALLAMATAEHFRDQGQQVLLLCDSLTRYAEAHRDVALSAGEVPSLRAYPPSTFRALAKLCERSGPGVDGKGDISAVFSVLVAGSDMEEPVADMVRGILDGHIVLDREIAERGRYPAINLRRSISRSLPDAATSDQNKVVKTARNYVSLYEDAQTLIRAGLYVEGSDSALDEAVQYYDNIDAFMSEIEPRTIDDSFAKLGAAITSSKKENDESDDQMATEEVKPTNYHA